VEVQKLCTHKSEQYTSLICPLSENDYSERWKTRKTRYPNPPLLPTIIRHPSKTSGALLARPARTYDLCHEFYDRCQNCSFKGDRHLGDITNYSYIVAKILRSPARLNSR
jgi:hypothetical protein